jgi:lipid-A-disaccharide synthase
MVLVYKMTAASYRIGRALIGLKYVGLPNIVAGRAVVPELIQDAAVPERIASELIRLLTNADARETMIRNFSGIRETLGDGGAARRAAIAVSRVLNTPAAQDNQ